MRKYLLEFLEGQKPGLVYQQDEKTGFFSWLRRIWLDRDDRVRSLSVVYTPISVMFGRDDGEREDNSFYARLGRMVRTHATYEEAVRPPPDMAAFAQFFRDGCDAFVASVKAKRKDSGLGSLLQFDCVDAQMGIFTLLCEVDGTVDCYVLMLWRKNVLESGNAGATLKFLRHLFGDRYDDFDIEIRSANSGGVIA